MSGREFSVTATAALVAEETDEVFLDLLIIDHADLAAPIRLVRNMENITHLGQTYIGMPFDIELPDEGERPGEARVSVDNVSREITNAIRSITSPPTVVYRLIVASDPDVIEYELSGLTLRDVTYDIGVVQGYLRYEDLTVEPVADTITPSRFPSMF